MLTVEQQGGQAGPGAAGGAGDEPMSASQSAAAPGEATGRGESEQRDGHKQGRPDRRAPGTTA